MIKKSFSSGSRAFSLAALMAGGFILPGCLATTQEVEDMRVDIIRLQNTLVKSQSSQSENQQSLQGNQADLMSQMTTLSRNLEIMSSHLEESQNRMTLLSTRLDDLDKNLSNRLDLLSQVMGSKQGVDPSPSALFTLAYNDFNRGRYDAALKGFQAYMEKYSDTEKAAEAQFYIGECGAALKKWDDAVDAYDKVLLKYSSSAIVPTAYLQKGLVLEKMGKSAEAVAVYDAIVRKYPNRQEAKAAQSKLDDLKSSAPEPKSSR